MVLFFRRASISQSSTQECSSTRSTSPQRTCTSRSKWPEKIILHAPFGMTIYPRNARESLSLCCSQNSKRNALSPNAHMFVQEDFYQFNIDMIEYVMTQLSMKAALKEWGKDAKIAAHAEVRQLHWRKTLQPIHSRDLTSTQHSQILELHMFLVQK
jgi:hypothetical protein